MDKNGLISLLYACSYFRFKKDIVMKQLMTGIFAALLAVGLTAGKAWATDYTWTGGGDGVTWNSTDNWKDGQKFVSSTSNRLIFENPTAGAVITLPGSISVHRIKFAAGCRSMRLTGASGVKITNTYTVESLTDANTDEKASIFAETTEPVVIDVIQVMTGGRSVGLAQGAHLEITKPIVDNKDKKGRVYFRTLGASKNSYLKIDYDPTAETYALDPKEGGFLFKFVGGTNELSAALTATAQTDPKPIVCESVGALKLNAGTYPREITFDSSSSDAMLQTVGAVTFGTNLVVGAKTFTLDFGGVTTLSGALRYTYNGGGNAQTLRFGADASLAGNVTVTGQGGAYTLDLAEGVCVDFLGDVTLTGANLNQPLPVGSRVNYRGSVTCSAFQDDGNGEPGAGHCGGEIHLYQPLSCGTFFVRGFNVVCEAANVLPSGKDIRWRYESQSNCAIVDMNGFDQTVTHLNCIGSFTSVNRNYITSAKPCTLTINDTFTEAGSVNAQVGVEGAISVVHGGTQVQEFNSRDINTDGELTINSGKIKLSGSTVIKNVPKITIGADGELVLAGTAAKPISDGTVLCFSSAGGCIDATDYQGTVLTLSNRVYVDGELVPYGTYTEENASWLKGGKITVTATAVIWREAVSGAWTDADKWTKLPEAGDKVCIDADGNDYVVSIAADNAAMGPLSIGNKSGTATLSVGAALSWPAWSTVAIGRGGRILVGDGGLLDYCSYGHAGDNLVLSTGGTLELSGSGEAKISTTGNSPMLQQGGDIVAGGTSKLTLDGGMLTYLGSGKTVLKDSAVLETRRGTDPKTGKRFDGFRLYTQTTVAGVTNHLVVKDQARIQPQTNVSADLDQVVFGYPNGTKDGLFRFDYGSAARSYFGNQIELGGTWGYAEMNVTAGLVAVGAYGIGVGGFHYDSRLATDANVVGVLNVSGGAIDVYASSFSFTKNRVRGLLLGEGWYDKKTATSKNLFTGYVNLSDGVISNRYGAVILGAGAAKGVWTQTGGAFVNDAAQTKGPMILGWLGGEGTYILSNGTVNVSSANVATYVGGAETNLTPWVLEAQAPSSADAARGLLSLQGGTFTTAGDVVVGQDGDGTIEVGANGRLSARSLELKVAAATAEKPAHSSTLKFTAGGRITLSGSLKSVADAQLEFDLTDWDKSTRLRFVSCNGLEGTAVDWDNVSFKGVERSDFSNAGGLKYVFRQTAHGIAVGKASGVAIIIR